MHSIVSLIVFLGWLAGIALAKGFWSTLIAIIFPLWAYYLLVEHLVNKFL